MKMNGQNGKPNGTPIMLDQELVVNVMGGDLFDSDQPAIVALPVLPQPFDKPSPTRSDTRSARYLRRLLAMRQPDSFERRVVPQAQLSDIDWTRVKKYVAAVKFNSLSPEAALLARGCLIKDEQGRLYPTYAGVLLFGRSPERFVPSTQVIAVRYNGLQMSDTYSRRDIYGSLPDQLDQVEAFVLNNLQSKFELKDLDWHEGSTLPRDAAHEVLVNALVHRDYAVHGDSVRICMFADRVEVYSPGRLPGRMTVDNLLTERWGRNEAVGRVLAEMGLMERLGAGLDRVVRRMAEEGLPAPKFEETAAGFKVTLFSQSELAQCGHLDTGTIRRWLAQGLYERQVKAMNFLLEKSRLTPADYQQLCPQLSIEILQRDLANLVERDLLLRVGDNGSTYYILK